jgi:hypothetical protein
MSYMTLSKERQHENEKSDQDNSPPIFDQIVVTLVVRFERLPDIEPSFAKTGLNCRYIRRILLGSISLDWKCCLAKVKVAGGREGQAELSNREERPHAATVTTNL